MLAYHSTHFLYLVCKHLLDAMHSFTFLALGLGLLTTSSAHTTTSSTHATTTTANNQPSHTPRVIDVQVGKDGHSSFLPDNVVAAPKDTLHFHFWTGTHSVARSDFNHPCGNYSGHGQNIFSGEAKVDAKKQGGHATWVSALPNEHRQGTKDALPRNEAALYTEHCKRES